MSQRNETSQADLPSEAATKEDKLQTFERVTTNIKKQHNRQQTVV